MRSGARGYTAFLVPFFAVLLAMTVGCMGSQPEARDVFVAARNDRVADVVLRAFDDDLVEGTGHELVFTLLTQPAHGTVLGDPRQVTYDWDEKVGIVRLGYLPRVNYVGRDGFTVLVEDSFGLSATLVVVVDVRGVTPPPGMSFSGGWDALVTITSSAAPPTLSSGLSLFWRIQEFSGEVRAGFGMSGLSEFTLVTDYALGALATVRATVSFDPSALAFSYLESRTRLTVLRFYGMDATHTLRFTGTDSSSYQRLTLRGSLDMISFTTNLTFGFHTLEFREWTVATSGGFFCCDLRLATRFTFRKTGFQELRVTLSDVPLGTCGPLAFKLQIPVVFSVDSKVVEPQITVESGWLCCARLRVELVTDGMTIQGIHVYGFEFKFEIPQGIEVWAATSLDPTRNAWVTGYAEYFEVWAVRGNLVPCCGIAGTWRLATYFHDQAGPSLFGWGMTQIMVDIPLGTFASFLLEYTVRHTANPDEIWTLKAGFRIRW